MINYFEIDAVSSGNLADFKLLGPDGVLEEKPPSLPFEMGKGHERFAQDASTGSQRFFERFFVADLDVPMPKELPGWIANNELAGNYVTTTAGKLDARYKSRHAWLDVCAKHPGKYPISLSDFQAFENMLVSLRKIRPWDYSDVTLGEILSWPRTLWQYPVYWTNENGVKCKILLDIVAFPVIDGSPTVLPIDLKWTQNISTFDGNFRRRYWIQERHYTAGAKAHWPELEVLPMIFPVSIHQPPYKSTLRRLDKNAEQAAQMAYEELVVRYAEWDAGGRQPQGYYKTRALRPWI